MYTETFFSADPALLVAVFSLLWFGVGVLTGMQTSTRLSSGRADKGGGVAGKHVVEMYVGNLAYGVRERDLSDAFKAHGKVVRARIIKNRVNGKSKGYGFVEMKCDEKPAVVVKALNDLELKGRKILVNEAKSRTRE